MKLYIFLFLSLFLSIGAFAQIPDIDSLKNVLSTAKGKDRLFILNEVSTHLREIDQELAFAYAEEANVLAQTLKNKSAEAKAKENIGWIYYRKGNWQQAFDYSKEAYTLSIESNNPVEAARVLNSIGALYYEQHNYLLAIDQFKKAFEISSKEGDVYTMIRSLNNIAYNYINLNELDSAIFYSTKAIRTNENAGSPYLISFSNRIIGDVYFRRNQLDSAEVIFEEALFNGESQGLSSFVASVLHRLGHTYLLNGKLTEAKHVLVQGVELSIEKGYLDELSKSHKYLAEYYRKVGDYRKAFEEQSKFVTLNDSLVNIFSRDRLALMQGMFQDDLDQTELELLQAQNVIQTSKLEQNQRAILLVSTATILILGLLVWLFYLNRNIKKYNANLVIQKQQIRNQNIELEAKSKQLEEINQTKNKLFSILGHDLKGPVGQVKSIIDLLFAGHLNQEEFEELIHDLKKDVDSVHFTLNNTLKWSMAQMEGFKLHKVDFNLFEIVRSNIKLSMPQLNAKSIHIDDSNISPDLKIYADRDLFEVVVRNVLNNAVKFSKPGDTIQLDVEKGDNSITLCVQDQGVGMREEQIMKLLSAEYVISNSKLGTKKEKGSGLGLQICKEFTRMNGGEIYINSKEGEGTCVCIQVPESQELVCNR